MNAVEVKLFTGQDAQLGCQLALKNKLYVPARDWTLREFLRKNVPVAIVFENSVPVAITAWDPMAGAFMAFCRKAKRKQGYASLAARTLSTELGIAILVQDGMHCFKRFKSGIVGSSTFWHKTARSMKK